MPGNLHHARESIRQELSPQALPSVAFVNSIEDAVRDADLVIDCVPDELESKLEIFWLLDRMAPPRTVIATPTIHQSIADLASCTNRREKCIAIAASPESLAAGAATDLLLRAAPFTSDETIHLSSSISFCSFGFRPRGRTRRGLKARLRLFPGRKARSVSGLLKEKQSVRPAP